MERTVRNTKPSRPIVVPKNAIGKVEHLDSKEVKRRKEQAKLEWVSWLQRKRKTSTFINKILKRRAKNKVAKRSRRLNRKLMK